MEKKHTIFGYILTDSSGMPANYVDGDELVFYRTKRAASTALKRELGKYGYKIRRIVIKTFP